MTAPTKQLTITERERLKSLTIELRQVVPAGRVMLCKGRRVVRHCDVADLAETFIIANTADTICFSPNDFADVQRWLAS